MRIELPRQTDRLGAVFVHGLQEVYELDSGEDQASQDVVAGWQMVRRVADAKLNEIKARMAVVVPVKGERLKVLQGVISGIPHQCLLIVVSNSPREPVDRFRMEREAITDYCRLVQRPAVIIHQRDPGLGAAFAAAGIPEILDADGLVRQGKGEGMLAGVVLAKLAGTTHVGFVDSDNYVPGAVHEYVNAYAAGFSLAKTPYTMVRISWRSKPSFDDGRLFFPRWGRTSQLTNQYLNLLLAEYTGFGTDVVVTGNSGEHAITMDLALRLRFAGGFAIEPFQWIDIFEQYGGVLDPATPDVMRRGVEIFQIETLNPHFHDKKGSVHIEHMRLQALNSILHSPVCPENVRQEILEFLNTEGLIEPGSPPPSEKVYPPLINADLDAFLKTLGAQGRTFRQVEKVTATTMELDLPIHAPGTEPRRWPAQKPTVRSSGGAPTDAAIHLTPLRRGRELTS